MRPLRYFAASITIFCSLNTNAQINADQVLRIGQNALYFEDYMLSIQYFNQVIAAKPYLAQPYFFRSIAKINLDDYKGAEDDATAAIERNPFITDAWEVRGVARQNQGNDREAIDDYNEALKLLPGNRSILFNKALAQEEIEDFDGAGETFAELIKRYPQFDGSYMGRARLYMLTGDTLAAKTDLDKAIELNQNATNAYVMRADIAMHATEPDYESAIKDMDMAIKLQPRYAGFFINRAYLRYMLDDYFGAMADYEYAIGLDPLNATAYFNRGLLRTEARDNDKAIEDFTKVLQLDRGNTMARYNRAVLYAQTEQWDKAIADIDAVIDKYPDLGGLYYTRFQMNYKRGGHIKEAQQDYDKAEALTKKEVAMLKKDKQALSNNPLADKTSESDIKEVTEKMVADRFTSLLTLENEPNLTGEYNNKSIRGKVQDRNVNIEIEPVFVLSYYDSPTELKETGYYIKDVDDVNSTQILRFMIQVTNRVPALEDESIVNTHFNSIEYYNSYLSSHTPRAIEYFGRGMDFMTTRNYTSAIADFTRAVNLTPDWSLPYFMRAMALYFDMKSPHKDQNEEFKNAGFEMERARLKEILDDLDKVEELIPTSPFAYYNKGTILLEKGDLTSAISALNKAIELKPDFGEAYFNRGYAYMQLGNRVAGAADLSKAGELGILPSYNLLKRMNQ